MAIDVKIPESGESVREVQIAQWLKQEGQWVAKDEDLVEIDTEKATLQIPAPAAGQLTKILKREGEMAAVGESVAQLDESATPASQEEGGPSSGDEGRGRRRGRQQREATTDEPRRATGAEAGKKRQDDEPRAMPAARRLMAEHDVAADEVEATGPGGRIVKEDVQRRIESRGDGQQEQPEEVERPESAGALPPPAWAFREEEVVPMSMLRRRIAARLVEAQQQAALLTTFNEVDMSAVVELRQRHRETFERQHGVKLGFMSFFVKAAVEALKRYPAVNAEVRDHTIVYRNYFDVGIAVGGGKGLVVPVLRNAERMSFAEIERAIGELAARAGQNKLKPEELEGGTFTISNGGIYGSMLSTPIVNPPQSGILGLHAIQDRPVARDGQVVIRPVMYLALSYDHRVVDGREAVSWLKHVKDVIEEPARMLVEI